MTDHLIIRPERPEDYAAVEQLTRAAFYNQYVPGCAEHYLVHILRDHPDFLPGLDLVAEWDGRLAGSLMATRASLTDEQGQGIPTVSFGPLSVAPPFSAGASARRCWPGPLRWPRPRASRPW